MTMLRSSMPQQITKSVGSKKKPKAKGYNLGGLKEGTKRTTNNKRKSR